jgi:hypothetical protein
MRSNSASADVKSVARSHDIFGKKLFLGQQRNRENNTSTAAVTRRSS